MAIRVGINGFGRIGRVIIRAAMDMPEIEIRAINLRNANLEYMVYMLKYDTVFGRFPKSLDYDKSGIFIDGTHVDVYSYSDALEIPWKEAGVDYVIDCTGAYVTSEKAMDHIDAGAKHVIISAPAKDNETPTFVYGVNHDKYSSDMKVVSNASCTTNCLAPVVKVLNEKFGIVSGWMTTVHAYTGDQQLLDKNHKDFRRARAANLSMIPTSTGAAKAIGLVLPELAGKLDGMAIRVPTPDVSVVELVVNLEHDATVEEINNAMRAAESKTFGYNELPLVSIDFTHDAHSSIFDAGQTKVLGDKLAHVTAWYDNEWGFSNRMCDTAVAMGKLIK